MIHNFFTTAYRVLRKNIGFSLINIFGLSLSLAVFMLILQFVSFELSYDAFHQNKEHIYRVESQFFKNGELTDDWASSSTGYGLAMQEAFPEIEAMTRLYKWNSERVVQYEDVKFREANVVAADASFFSFFSFPLIEGNPKKVLSDPNTVVISESYRKKYFGNKNPLGKTIKISDVQRTYICEVTGVFADFPANSHLHYDIIYSWATVASHWKTMDTFWYKHSAYTYVSLPSADAARHIEQQFPALAEKHKTEEALKDLVWGVELTPLLDIHLNAWKAEEVEVKGSWKAVWFLSVMALLIMLIAWINYTNLSTIKSIERTREVGVKKAMGIGRSSLMMQFLAESAVVSLLATVVAVGLTLLFHQLLAQVAGVSFPLRITPEIVLIFLALLLLGVIASGSYPAIVLASLQPVKALKGDTRNSVGGNLLRKALITFQFAASIVLISVTYLIYQQLQYMKTQDTGIATEQTIVINAPVATDNYYEYLESFKQELLHQSSVKNVTYSSSVPGHEVGMFLSNKRKGSEENKLYEMLRTDYEYLDTYELNILQGRNFSRNFKTDEQTIILNEEAVAALGFTSAEEALQQEVYLETSSTPFKIIGVAENFHQTSLENPFTPIMIFISPDFRWIPYNYLSIKLSGSEVPTTIANIEDRWNRYFPASPMDYYFLDGFFARQYANEEFYEKIFIAASVFAVFISCLGLFGLTYYTVVLKRKEIGVRKVLGASSADLVSLLSRNYVYLLGLALLLATPVSYFILHQWLQNYTFRIELGALVFLLPLLLLLPIVLFTVGSLTFKATRVNPTQALRCE
uniref:ABC transporter permease n=1 Tax=Roseihalotalea indica TaxID=2867963 RepID=A0AA49JJL7_9BACT|nr:ABC transporter permease [Tunicatimonas sp. TK19036]